MKTTPASSRQPLGARLGRALSRASSIAPSAGAAALALAFLHPTGASAQTVVTQDTEGTTNWLCPAGVTSVQIECWGGGGAGGSAKRTSTASTNYAGGGGGAGGAYAVRFSVPVTPGVTYDLTVPPAAVAADSSTATNGLRIDGSTVMFTGDGGVTVTAAGGQGGACVIDPGAKTSGDAGIASPTGSSEGDVIFIGGNGAKPTTAGQSGGGGGGAGDANNGGNAANTTAGSGGVAGGGNGGTGRAGDAPGGLGLNAGGGGGGGRSQNHATIDFRAGGNGGLGRVTLTYFDNKLAITSVPASATAGVDFSVTVQAQDSGGTPVNVSQDTVISLGANGTGTLSGNTATILSGTNSVTLNTVQYTKAEAITLTASQVSGDALGTSLPSPSITVDAAAAAQIVFTTQPSASTEPGLPFATQPVVQILDAFDNLVTTGSDASANVALTLTAGAGTLGGTTNVNAVAGVADFSSSGLNIDVPGTDKELTAEATIGAGTVTATTSPFTITATALTWSATPATFDWNTTDSNWTGGTGVYTDPGTSAVTFDDNGDASSPINVVETLQPVSVTVNGDTNNYTFSGSGDVSGTTGITKNGTSTLTVTNANTYSGSTIVNAGTVVMANPAALGDGTGLIRFPGSSTGTLRISTDSSDTPYSIGSNSATADPVADTWSTDFTIASDLATPGPGITHALGELNLAQARLNIVAGPNVSGGNPKLTFSSMIATSASANPPAKINPTTASVSIGNVTTLNNTAKTLYLGGTSTGNEITGDITPGVGTLAVTKTDTSTWTLSGANTYTGVTTVNGGTLLNGSATTFANNGDLDVDGTGILDLNGFDASFTNLTDDNTAGIITNSAAGDAKTITFTNTADDDDAGKSAVITGNLTLAFANSNSSATMWGLGATNTFTGGIVLLDGATTGNTLGTRLRISGIGATEASNYIGTGPITIGLANTDKASILASVSDLELTNDLVFNTALGTDSPGYRLNTAGQILSGQITANLANATFSSSGTDIGSGTITGKITGDEGLHLLPDAGASGALSITLSNAAMDNDYAGDTTISLEGSSVYALALGAADQIPNGASAGNVINDGTLDLDTFSDTINGLSGTGIVQANGGTLTVGDNDATSTFDGVLLDNGGSLALTKIGTGTLTLNGANTHTGDTTVEGGVLAINGTSIDDSSTLVIDGGVVDVTGNEVVGALFFGLDEKAEGTYGSSSSVPTPDTIDDTRFSGTGIVTVIPAAGSGFASWISAGGFANDALLVGNDGPNDDPDNDGISNLVEYALDGFDPTASNAAPGSISGLLVTYTKRALAVSNGDVAYAIEESTDLGASDPWQVATPTDNNDSIITYTLTPPAPSKDFVRLVVTQN